MRVLTLVHSLGHGGMQRCAVNYSVAYREQANDARLLAFWGGGELQVDVERAGIPLLLGGADSRERERAVEEALEWRPALVHVHRPGMSDPFGPLIERFARAGARVIETNVFSRPDYSPAALHIDLHLHLSRWCLWKWTRWSRDLNPRPLGVVLPYMVDTKQFFPDPEAGAAFRERHRIPEDALVIGRIGQALTAKWSPHMIDAYTALASENEQVHLLVVSAPPGIQRRIAKLPPRIGRRVLSLGAISGYEALRAAYAAMDVFLHAADIGESFGMVLGEAMACGVPVVTLATPTRDNSQMEVVEHQRTGLVAANARSLSEAIRRIITDSALRKRLAAAARRTVVSRFSPQAVTPLLQRVLALVTTARDSDHLASLIAEDASLTSQVSDAEIERILRNSIGRVGLQQRMLMRVVHQPMLYRMYSRCRHLLPH